MAAAYFIPAPEEFRALKDFAAACRPSLRECEKVYREHFPGSMIAQDGLAKYFKWCWKQPEAEEIHAAFNRGAEWQR